MDGKEKEAYSKGQASFSSSTHYSSSAETLIGYERFPS